MKTAFVFSGLLREVDRHSNSILNKIKEFDADVYGSFWDVENYSENSTIENFKIKYNPKKLEIESYKNWFESNWDIIKEEHFSPTDLRINEYEDANKPNIYAMWYKIWKANMLTKEEDYDVIVRIRTDIGLSQKFTVVKNDFINFPHGIVYLNSWSNSFGMHDFLAYGNPEIMDYFSSTFLYLSRYLKEGVYFYPYENVLRHHLAQRNIPIRFYGDSVYLRHSGNVDMNNPDKQDLIINSREWNLPQDYRFSFYRERI